MASEYTPGEMMVAAAAREIDDGDTAFVGMRLPLLAFQVAVETHAPNALAIYESGVIRDTPAERFIHTMCDLPNIDGAVATTGMSAIMERLQRGEVDVGFLGGAEIDRYGNLNTTRVRADGADVRLPGSGGGCDIAALSGRTVLILPHEPRRFVEEVNYVTSPGHTENDAARGDYATPGGGPETLVTSKATFGFDDTGELYLRSVHPGVDAADIADDFSWTLKTADDVGDGEVTTTPEPSQEALTLVRRFDPDGFWTG
jgi:glutaconate CoA-transferase subunit B